MKAIMNTNRCCGAGLVLSAAFPILSMLCVGCGAGGGPELILEVEASYDHLFYPPPERELSEAEKNEIIVAEIERLTSGSWRLASKRLFQMGRDAIPYLIGVLDRDDEAQALPRPVPGLSLPEGRVLTLGDVAYSVLADLVSKFTDYSGTELPRRDKPAWEAWWNRNARSLEAYSPASALPGYVKKQYAEAGVYKPPAPVEKKRRRGERPAR